MLTLIYHWLVVPFSCDIVRYSLSSINQSPWRSVNIQKPAFEVNWSMPLFRIPKIKSILLITLHVYKHKRNYLSAKPKNFGKEFLFVDGVQQMNKHWHFPASKETVKQCQLPQLQADFQSWPIKLGAVSLHGLQRSNNVYMHKLRCHKIPKHLTRKKMKNIICCFRQSTSFSRLQRKNELSSAAEGPRRIFPGMTARSATL